MCTVMHSTCEGGPWLLSHQPRDQGDQCGEVSRKSIKRVTRSDTNTVYNRIMTSGGNTHTGSGKARNRISKYNMGEGNS